MSITKEELEAYQADKLENADTLCTALKLCDILYHNCSTTKQIERTLAMVQQITDIARKFTPERYG